MKLEAFNIIIAIMNRIIPIIKSMIFNKIIFFEKDEKSFDIAATP
jgi:hypothetical protein